MTNFSPTYLEVQTLLHTVTIPTQIYLKDTEQKGNNIGLLKYSNAFRILKY